MLEVLAKESNNLAQSQSFATTNFSRNSIKVDSDDKIAVMSRERHYVKIDKSERAASRNSSDRIVLKW